MTKLWLVLFFPMPLYRCREVNPRIVTLLLVRDFLISKETFSLVIQDQNFLFRFLLKILDDLILWSYLSWLPRFLGVGVIGFDQKLIDCGKFSVQEWEKKDYVLNCWVVNSPQQKEELKKYNVTITTDYLFDKMD